MSFKTKKPPIRIMVDIETFNNIVEVVSNIADKEDEKYSLLAERMKEKLLKFSIPRTDENGETNIDMRFFCNEAEALIYFLLSTVDTNTETNYYEVLLKVRESYKKEQSNEE